jgi:hypothetical protein
MDTKQIPPAKLEPAPTPAQPASSLRLYILLGLLAVVVGAYGYDYFVAKPGCEAADKKIQDFVDARNKLGVKEGALVTSADIQKELGMKPTYVERHDDKQYTVEYYCWWGKMPMLSKRRHFISVVYVGPQEPRRVSSHHREEPPPEALPLDPTLAGKGDSSPGSDAGADTGAELAPASADTPQAPETKSEDANEGKTKSAEETPAEKT